ncbi:hypothetical protein J3Q64DRAFT_1692482 [Phycomyces blakesleeanus]|uniref:Uncharacterized protein n=1 Tax=Phycomyces blakesleeanus TaxID=4837 RepID=A0ABR3BAY1_PHYBL
MTTVKGTVMVTEKHVAMFYLQSKSCLNIMRKIRFHVVQHTLVSGGWGFLIHIPQYLVCRKGEEALIMINMFFSFTGIQAAAFINDRTYTSNNSYFQNIGYLNLLSLSIDILLKRIVEEYS